MLPVPHSAFLRTEFTVRARTPFPCSPEIRNCTLNRRDPCFRQSPRLTCSVDDLNRGAVEVAGATIGFVTEDNALPAGVRLRSALDDLQIETLVSQKNGD